MPGPRLTSGPLPILLAGVPLVTVHYLIFGPFFRHATIGHDYQLFLPQLLDGFFWFHRNGPLAVPWFTPAFCGGVPKFPNPQALYYSVPQLFTFFVDPLTAVTLTFVTFSALGFWGFHLLLSRAFGVGTPLALLGAVLFLFNGLYAHRMLIGHLTFHSFMLIPWLCFVLLRPEPASGQRWRFCFDVAVAGLVIAYTACAGIAHVLFQSLTVVLLIAFAYGLCGVEELPRVRFTAKLGAAGLLGLSLASAQLVAVLSYLRSFPRTLYPLPGVPDLRELVRLLAGALFSTPSEALFGITIVNSPWLLERHEFEFGVTFIPAALMILGIVLNASRMTTADYWAGWSRAHRIYAALGALLLAGPVALNYYSPTWNAVLKRIPIFTNSVILFRWISIWIPSSILLGILAAERTAALRARRIPITVAGIAIVLGLNATADRTFYERQTYDPRVIVEAYERVKSGAWTPAITTISVSLDETFRSGRNDLLARGASQLSCYEPLFGYRLEAFPRKTLRPGPALEARDGVLNLKNPACYVFPGENDCSPGDHFLSAELPEARAFTHYEPIPFVASRWQRLANAVTLCALALTGASIIAYAARRAIDRQSQPGP